ncbi:MAG: hypothetical protein L0213_00225, partial [Candidatus Dadabacteria bacterium]|nr:hypothetical protein [Candidatus Dadabacteria bacterium]
MPRYDSPFIYSAVQSATDSFVPPSASPSAILKFFPAKNWNSSQGYQAQFIHDLRQTSRAWHLIPPIDGATPVAIKAVFRSFSTRQAASRFTYSLFLLPFHVLERLALNSGPYDEVERLFERHDPHAFITKDPGIAAQVVVCGIMTSVLLDEDSPVFRYVYDDVYPRGLIKQTCIPYDATRYEINLLFTRPVDEGSEAGRTAVTRKIIWNIANGRTFYQHYIQPYNQNGVPLLGFASISQLAIGSVPHYQPPVPFGTRVDDPVRDLAILICDVLNGTQQEANQFTNDLNQPYSLEEYWWDNLLWTGRLT